MVIVTITIPFDVYVADGSAIRKVTIAGGFVQVRPDKVVVMAETADMAAETLAGELHPIDDVRSTAEYRRLVAARVLHRLIRETGGW